MKRKSKAGVTNLRYMKQKYKEMVLYWSGTASCISRGGKNRSVENIYTRLKAYESYGVNGTIDLQLEKAKQEYHRLQIPAMRRSIAHCHPNKEHYEQRLQILGLQAELDELESVIPALQQLMQDIQDAEISNGSNGLYFKTLRVSILQLYMLCVQGNGIIRRNLKFIYKKFIGYRKI